MKYVLILMLTGGAPPVTPGYHMLTSAEFDDFAACEFAVKEIKATATSRVVARCFPKGSKEPEAKPEAK